MKKKLILASASPRRQAILKDIFGEIVSMTPNFLEQIQIEESPKDYVIRNSLGKARSVFQNLNPENRLNQLILAADTIVVLEQEVLEKPADIHEAKQMLERLSGRTHEVLTGFALVDESGKEIAQVVSTKVVFRELTPELIDAYVATGEPLDKAGSYGIQGLGGYLIDKIEGSYWNVVGLPVAQVMKGIEMLS